MLNDTKGFKRDYIVKYFLSQINPCLFHCVNNLGHPLCVTTISHSNNVLQASSQTILK